MKRALAILITTLLAAAFVIPCVAAAGASPAPPLVFTVIDEPDTALANRSVARYDFGMASELSGVPITHTFVLANGNPESLVIGEVQPSCGCTTAVVAGANGKPMADPAGLIVPAHTRIDVTVSVDPLRLSPGEVEKTVQIFVKGQSQPAATLEMAGSLDTGAVFSNKAVDFGDVAAGTGRVVNETVTLDPRAVSQGAQVTLVSDNPDVLVQTIAPTASTVAEQPGRPSSRSYRIEIGPRAPLGPIDGNLVLATARPGASIARTNIFIPLTGRIVGSLNALPSAIAFGLVDSRHPDSRRVTVMARLPADLDGLSVAAPQRSGLRVRLLPRVPGARTVFLIVAVTSAAPPGTLQTQITVLAANGERLDLPVTGYVVRGV